MTSDSSGLALVSIGLLAAAIGAIDAALSGAWDLFILFLVVALSLVTVVLQRLGDRVAVSLRPDLAQWLRSRSQSTGEPFNDALDRSVATARHGLYGNAERS